MKGKKGIEFGFSWIFAVLIGGAIIFLAVYAAIRLVTTERTVQDTELAKQLESILTPIETGEESAKAATPISFPVLSRVYNNCTIMGNFGEQKIAVATSSGIGGKWQDPGFESTSYNKYIFSPDIMEGKEFYVFSKPFEMPFKVANVIFMWSDNYCFINPYEDIRKDVESLGLKKINVTNKIGECPKNSKIVCFGSGGPSCNIVVGQNTVTKNGRMVYYDEGGALLYGAIFSEPEVYECQFNRLMKRASGLAALYAEKSEIISSKADGCSSNLGGELRVFSERTLETNKSSELIALEGLSGSLNELNERTTSCKLWVD